VGGAGGVGVGGVGGGLGGGAGVVGAGVGSGPESHHLPPHCPQAVGLEPHQPPEHSPLPVSQPPDDRTLRRCRAASEGEASAISDTKQAEKRIAKALLKRNL